MAQVITIAGERLFALKAQNNQQLDIDTFIFAFVPGQDSSAPIDRNEGLPPIGQRVHTQIVQQTGLINENAVVYSSVLDSLTGPFDFNWVGLYSSVNQTLIAIIHTPTVSKTVTVPGAAGNILNRNFVIEYSGIAELTGITVDPTTWQYDFEARLNGMDELTRQLAADMNGKDWFIDDGFKVVPRSTLNTFKVTAGVGYVSGLRVELTADHILTLSSYPQFVYVDAWFEATSESIWKGKVAFTVTNSEMDDYIDVNGRNHYVFKLARITAADAVKDLRIDKNEVMDSRYSTTFSTVNDMKVANLKSSYRAITGGFSAYGDGGGAEYLITEGNTEIDGIKVIKLDDNLKATRVHQPKFNASCTFIFDDGYVSHLTVMEPFFTSKGFSFGCAINTANLDNTGKLTKEQLLALKNKGVEIINHAYSGATQDNSKTSAMVLAEINTAVADMASFGIYPDLYQTPSSVLGTDHINLVKSRFTGAFTKSAPASAMRITDQYSMFRHSIEALTEQQCMDRLRDAAIYGGAVVFYCHDIVANDALYQKIEALINYATSLGIAVKKPSECIKDGIITQSAKSIGYQEGPLIFNRRDGWSASGATVSVDSNKDLRITAENSVNVLLQRTLPLEVNANDAQILTFSAALRSISGIFGSGNYIGFKMMDTNGNTLRQIEEPLGNIDTYYRRWSAEMAKMTGVASCLIYFRINFQSAGECLVRDPIVRFGNSVRAIIKKEPSDTITVQIPAQTKTKANNTALTLTDAPSNGLFAISGNKLAFKRQAKVCISANVGSYGAGINVGMTGAAMSIDWGKGKAMAAVTGGNDFACGGTSVTIDVDSNTNAAILMLSFGIDFAVSETYSKINVVEMM